MAQKTMAGQINSQQMDDMVAAIVNVVSVTEANLEDITKVCEFFGPESSPCSGKDGDQINDAFAEIKKICDLCMTRINNLKAITQKKCEQLNIGYGFAGQKMGEALDNLTQIQNSLKK